MSKNIIHQHIVARWKFPLLLLLLPAMAISQQRTQPAYPPDIAAAGVEVYKSVDDTDLRLWIFTPEDHNAGQLRPAAIFFFGGGWRRGNPSQFRKHCEYLADRGMVSMIADYRVSSRHGVTANQCVADAKSAIRWMRKHADRLGIDPDRIVAGGGSAGGHLAAATATLPNLNDPHDNLSISAQPNALVLFNPAVLLAPVQGKFDFSDDRINNLRKRTGVNLEHISPYHHVRPGLPPTIIFHGIADTTVPYQTVELYREKMIAKGNRCVLVGYEGAAHGFFNYGRGDDNAAFVDTISKMDDFLVSLGYLTGAPKTVQHE